SAATLAAIAVVPLLDRETAESCPGLMRQPRLEGWRHRQPWPSRGRRLIMSNPGSRFRIALLAASALSIIPSVAIAQHRMPARAGNIWDGMNHEPVPSKVMR